MIGATGSPEAIPYESVVDALRSALPLLASLKATMPLACVSALLPEIRARIPSLPNPPHIDAESERMRLFESVFRCLADLSTSRPLLVVLEDLQWAQAASISLLQFLLRRIPGVRVMIVVTYRDDDTPRPHPLHRLRNEARAAGSAMSLSLSPLSIGDLEQLAGAMHEIRAIPAATLLATSAGNPLFVTQLVDDYRKGDRTFAPENLHALVARRIEQLSPDARSAAEIAAYVGTQFSRDVLREVSGWDAGTLGVALDELIDRRPDCSAKRADGASLSTLSPITCFTMRFFAPRRPSARQVAATESHACSRNSIPIRPRSSRRQSRFTTSSPAPRPTRRGAISWPFGARSRSVRWQKRERNAIARSRSRPIRGSGPRYCLRARRSSRGAANAELGTQHSSLRRRRGSRARRSPDLQRVALMRRD